MGKRKGVRMGGKYTKSHTTVIPAAGVVVDIANRSEYVTKIVLGFIKAGLRSGKGRKSVRVIPSENGSFLLSVRDNTSNQEIRIYTNNDRAIDDVTAKLKEAGFTVTVRDGV